MDKNKAPFFFGLIICLILFSCGETKEKGGGNKSLLPLSSGKYGEVLIVVDTLYENGKTGEVLDKIFFKALDGMPQQEAQFRASTVPSTGFKSILKRSRNILKLSIGKGKKTAITIEEDVWARDQLMLKITAASDEDAARILGKNVETIRNYFNEKEISRLQKQYAGKPQKEIMSKIESDFGIEITIAPGYVEMSKTEEGFWLKKEKTIGQHQVLQGLVVYTQPYESDSVFTNRYMIDQRNLFTKENIQGSRDSSFMAVYEEYVPVTQEINLNGLYAVEYRGLWNMRNDFMGGPFLHYSLVDEINNRVIHLDGFVYAPKFNKREYLRELEATMKTMKLAK